MEDLDLPDQEENEFQDQYMDEEQKEDDNNMVTQNNGPSYCMPGLEPLEYEMKVCDPTIKDGLTKYYIYSVKGSDSEGAFDVLRRYKDFYALRSAFVSKWPGCYIPPLPPKKAIGNMGKEFIDERCKQLNKFCNEIVKCPHLYNSEEFQTFLRTRAGDIEKALSSLPRETTERIIQKYHAAFYSLSGVIQF